LNIDDKTFKHCFNIYKKHYRLKRKLNGQSEWSEFRVGKSNLENLIKNGMTSGGTEFKSYPYDKRFFRIIKWNLMLIIDFIKKGLNKIGKKLKTFFDSGYWKLIGGILLIIYALIKFKIISFD